MKKKGDRPVDGLTWDSKTQTFIPIFLSPGVVAIQFFTYVTHGSVVIFINTTKMALKVSFTHSPFLPNGAPESFDVGPYSLVFRRVDGSAPSIMYEYTVDPDIGGATTPPDGPAVIVG
jgi:hypothetical protein